MWNYFKTTSQTFACNYKSAYDILVYSICSVFKIQHKWEYQLIGCAQITDYVWHCNNRSTLLPYSLVSPHCPHKMLNCNTKSMSEKKISEREAPASKRILVHDPWPLWKLCCMEYYIFVSKLFLLKIIILFRSWAKKYKFTSEA